MEKLKEIEDHAARIPLKEKLLEKYRPYLKEFIEQEQSHQNDVLYLNMVWAVDCKQWDWMIELAEYAHKMGQKPVKPWFKSNPYTAIADPIHNIEDKKYIPVKNRKEGDKSVTEFSEGAISIFNKIHSGEWDIHPITKARYYRLFGIKFYEEDKDYQLAYDLLSEGTQIKDDLGVKTRIKELQELLNPESEPEEKSETETETETETKTVKPENTEDSGNQDSDE